MTVAPHDLEVGDVVQEIQVDRYQQHKARRCRILSIEERDNRYYRQSMVHWLDTGLDEPKTWKAVRGVSRVVDVYDGPKIEALRSGRGDVEFNSFSSGYIWRGYL